MNESGGIDISKVISVIMENPRLIEEISTLVSKSESPPEPTHEIPESKAENEEPKQKESLPASAGVSYGRGNRAQLLGALKPYVSKERAKAIDSMLSIADILDMMRAR